jgi:hypothetical protein
MDLLAIYLQDHLALSLGGIRLARRCRRENAAPPLAPFLDRLVAELEEERRVLREVAAAVGSGPSPLKEAGVVVGEWAGRLKLNGSITSYSELSRVWELEALLAGSTARLALWRMLRRVAKRTPELRSFDLAPLEARARGHVEALERQRERAADAAFAPRRMPRRPAEARVPFEAGGHSHR